MSAQAAFAAVDQRGKGTIRRPRIFRKDLQGLYKNKDFIRAYDYFIRVVYRVVYHLVYIDIRRKITFSN